MSLNSMDVSSVAGLNRTSPYSVPSSRVPLPSPAEVMSQMRLLCQRSKNGMSISRTLPSAVRW